MKKKLAIIWIIALMLTLGLPAAASASAVHGPYAKSGLSFATLINDCYVNLYVTEGAGTIAKVGESDDVTFSQTLGWKQYKATANQGWVFKGWSYTLSLRNGTDVGNRKDGLGNYTFVAVPTPGASATWHNPYVYGQDTIELARLVTLGEIADGAAGANPLYYEVYADFNPIITASAGAGGSISNPGAKEVPMSSDQIYYITPDEGYRILDVKLDGVSKGAQTSISFNPVRAPHNIEAAFTSSAQTVTYKDGVNGAAFADQVNHTTYGAPTPEFVGQPSRFGYSFMGWSNSLDIQSISILPTVTGDVTYTAIWQPDLVTILFKDGANETVFPDLGYVGFFGNDTPPYSGSLERDGYVFTGWSPALDKTLTVSRTYVAQWAKMHSIVYSDGVDNVVVFEDQAFLVKDGDPTPVFNSAPAGATSIKAAAAGTEPTREGYIFTGWDPEIAEFATADVQYVATWKAIEPTKAEPTKPAEPTPPAGKVTPKDKVVKTGDDSMAGVIVLMMFVAAGVCLTQMRRSE